MFYTYLSKSINFLFFLAPLGLSLSAPSGVLQQAFIKVRQARVDRSNTLDPASTEPEPSTVPSTDVCLNSSSIPSPPEAVVSTTSTASQPVSVASTATSSPPIPAGRVSPSPVSAQSHTGISDSSPPPQTSNETAHPQVPPSTSIPSSSSTVSPPSTLTTVPSVPGPQSNSSTVSSGSSSSSSGGTSEQQAFNGAGTSSQTQPPTSLPSQTQIQSQPVDSEGAEVQSKLAGRDDIQALDMKLRSLFKDSSVSMETSQNTGTSSPPPGTCSPPPGTTVVPPSNLPIGSGVQGVVGSTTTPSGHAQTPPSKARSQVCEQCSTYR